MLLDQIFFLCKGNDAVAFAEPVVVSHRGFGRKLDMTQQCSSVPWRFGNSIIAERRSAVPHESAQVCKAQISNSIAYMIMMVEFTDPSRYMIATTGMY
jgi:hypothetical protein